MNTLLISGVSAALLSGSSANACGIAWSPTIKDALSDAALTKRLAVVVFTGSDWSARGLQLDETVFMNPEFADQFMKNFALVNADFPQRKIPSPALSAENTSWATKLGIKSWPTLVALRADGSEFARLEYSGEPAPDVAAILGKWLESHGNETRLANPELSPSTATLSR